jgi:hypothetical protein
MGTPGVGELSLQKLLSTLTLTLHAPTYVFATVPPSQLVHPFPIPWNDIAMFIREAEGATFVIPLTLAQKYDGLDYQYPCRMITCNVHSSLEAVGFMATLATRLADEQISVNPVSGYYHDHLFVPDDRAEEAISLLNSIRVDAERTIGESKEA